MYHAGKVGKDGKWLKYYIKHKGINTDLIFENCLTTGHAIFQSYRERWTLPPELLIEHFKRACKVEVVDSTAGDTFLGFFIGSVIQSKNNILPTGKINFNSKFMKQIKSPYIGIYLKKDASEFLIPPLLADEKAAYCLPKSGSVSFPELTRKLTQKGVNLPVHYDMNWDEGKDIWIGKIQKNADVEKNISKNRKKIKQGMSKLEDLI